MGWFNWGKPKQMSERQKQKLIDNIRENKEKIARLEARAEVSPLSKGDTKKYMKLKEENVKMAKLILKDGKLQKVEEPKTTPTLGDLPPLPPIPTPPQGVGQQQPQRAQEYPQPPQYSQPPQQNPPQQSPFPQDGGFGYGYNTQAQPTRREQQMV
jgi:hypothetical protein